ncbi:MAG: hypothetical protein JST35_01615 [Armatimonadetes bacterium]|nr:hypothetical protein [Armatimonadota bacterium]
MTFPLYEERSIRHIRNVDRQNWTIKVYAIHQEGESVPGQALETGIDLAFSRFDQSRESVLAVGTDWNGLETYGVGVLMVHLGREALFAILAHWTGENMLRQETWVASREEPTRWEDITPSGLTTCVWELAVLCHERQAWIEHVLRPGNLGAKADYLNDVLNADL